MSIEVGSEWFKRDTLTVVTVIRQWPSSGSVMLHAPVGPMFEVTEDIFLRDYAPNVPVTLGLLERMGWDREPGVEATSYVSCHVANFIDSDGEQSTVELAYCFDYRGDIREFDFWIEWRRVPMATPATLRDLLLVLRVFGVAAEVPGDETATQTGSPVSHRLPAES